tara:strand:+ start:14506 stop:15204 length:699 start_codon:yes stop_codon:yes gene_type:complete
MHQKTSALIRVFVLPFFLFVFNGPVHAVVIPLDSSVASGLFSSSTNGQSLENALNTHVFNPLNTTIEFGATDGGTSAVDHMQFEGPGLVFVTGFGFVVRFDNAVSNVRVRFSNFKDDASPALRAFDSHVDYTRSASAFNQHAQGNPVFFPPTSSILDLDSGILPAGNDDFLDLNVSDPSGGILAVLVSSNRFLTNVVEIEYELAAESVPAPGAVGLLGLGLIAVSAFRRPRA